MRSGSADDLPFRPEGILEALAEREVAYVLIGGLAAVLHGSPHVTNDVDICPDSDRRNLERLADALEDLGALVYSDAEPKGLPFDRSAEMLERGGIWNLITTFGRLDVTFVPTGTQGYADLKRDAETMRIRGLDVQVASLADVIRSKDAAGREKDRISLPTLRLLLDRMIRRQRGD